MEGIRLDTSLREVGEFIVVDLVGEVDVYTAPALKDALNQAIERGQRHLIVNMERVTYMDSSGFGMLLSAMKRVRPEGGSINLVQCNKAIARMLTITRLNTIFFLHSSVEEAIDRIQAQQTSPA